MKSLLISLTLTVLVAGCLILLKMDPRERTKKAWTHDNSHLDKMTQDHNHPWMNNAWYRYVYNRTTEKNCFVCSHMPATSVHATIYGKVPSLETSMCIHMKVINGTCSHRDMFIVRALAFSLLTYDVNNLTATNWMCDEAHRVNVNVSNKRIMTFPAFLQSEERHPICFDFSYGRTKLGRTKNCSIVWKDNADADMTFKRGTYWVQGTAWVCGPKTYYMLPPNATDDGVQLTPVQNHTIEYGAPMSHRNSNSGPLDRKYFMPCFLGWAQEKMR
ncbi:unnamed protein product [Oreochromis niloticus]|nr:unnamed protein product [Mustela putorius furo]